MIKGKQPEGFGEGIYFDMDNDAYHKDPAVGRTGIVKLLISEYDYWESSCLNPDHRSKETEAMKFGKLAEFFLFEEKKFLQTYNVAGGGWTAGKRTLSRTDFDNVVQSARLLRKDKVTAAYFLDGYPQVSIFYRDPITGVMLKVRPDWLRTWLAVDLKRLKSIQIGPMGWAISDHGYDIQEAMCIDAVLHAKERLRRIDPKFKIVGTVDKAWLKRFIDEPDFEFRFIMQRSVKPYIYRIEYMSQFIRARARRKIATGIWRYKGAIEKYGIGEWPAGTAVPHEFQEVNLPMRSFDE